MQRQPTTTAASASAAMLWATVLCFLATQAAVEERAQIKPSLECTCQTSQRVEDRFSLNCQRAGGVQLTNNGGTTQEIRNEQSSFSCEQGGPVASSVDWWFVKVPNFGVYRMGKRTLTWEAAEEACEAEKEQLVALDGGEAEMKAMLSAFAGVAKDGNQLFWVGIRYIQEERKFYTVRGQEMVALPWTSGHPLSGKREFCVSLGREAKLHGPHGCYGKRRFFCKE